MTQCLLTGVSSLSYTENSECMLHFMDVPELYTPSIACYVLLIRKSLSLGNYATYTLFVMFLTGLGVILTGVHG